MGHTKPFSFPLQRELSVKERVQQQSHRCKDLDKLCYPQAQVQWSLSSVHLCASTPVKLVLRTWACVAGQKDYSVKKPSSFMQDKKNELQGWREKGNPGEQQLIHT